jgi:hypothetical protein
MHFPVSVEMLEAAEASDAARVVGLDETTYVLSVAGAGLLSAAVLEDVRLKALALWVHPLLWIHERVGSGTRIVLGFGGASLGTAVLGGSKR